MNFLKNLRNSTADVMRPILQKQNWCSERDITEPEPRYPRLRFLSQFLTIFSTMGVAILQYLCKAVIKLSISDVSFTLKSTLVI